ncbi:carboxypeptidase regulatory-like domain-containing protein [Caloramator sp. E03]|uniref:carboxypeptidase-like regulatory domain-containing protein n=1 Tax=Caloramator sp. E03 TaxID=2576307 RepID=UPI001110E113|nr:carboxypeptidase-like regulatory domain-containing protein [Caloramator sp. E03]QCX32208.1 carboxypeptidase regulatory-like domain-containing protein [Caloramator sp. E03]
MKFRLIALITIIALVIVTVGCLKKSSSTNVVTEIPGKQKMIVVVLDKQTNAPIKDAKVYIVGDNTVYTTDDMGKTPEIDVEINKDYFSKYTDEVANRMNCGLVNIVAVKEGYGKHLEVDYNLYPGNSTSVAKIQLSKNKKATTNCNLPDVNYIENIIKAYERFEGEGIKTENMIKYKITVTDESSKPIEGVKIVIPEAKLSSSTNKKGIVEVDVPFDNSSRINYPVLKDYGEVTVIAYKDGYATKVVLRAQINNDKNNTINLKLKKSDGKNYNYEIVQPKDSWIEKLLSSYN